MSEAPVKQSSQVFSVRLSAADTAIIQRRADTQALAISDYMRSVLLQTKPPRSRVKVAASVRDDLLRLLLQLGEIGSDMNQLSAVARARGDTPQLDILERSHAALIATLDEVREAFR